MPHDHALERFARFVASGGSATGCHWLLMWLLISAGMPAAAATAGGCATGAATSYLLQRNWTFRSNARHRDTAPRFLAAAGAAWLANLAIFILLNQFARITAGPAQAITSIAVALLSYFLYSRLVFHETSS